MKNTQNLNSKMIKTKNILIRDKKIKSNTYKIKKKRELRKKKYIRRTRKNYGNKFLFNIPSSNTGSENNQKIPNSSKEVSISSEGFNIFNDNDNFGSSEMISSYDLGNVFSPVSDSIFGDVNTIFDMSLAPRKSVSWGKFFFLFSKLTFQGKTIKMFHPPKLNSSKIQDIFNFPL